MEMAAVIGTEAEAEVLDSRPISDECEQLLQSVHMIIFRWIDGTGHEYDVCWEEGGFSLSPQKNQTNYCIVAWYYRIRYDFRMSSCIRVVNLHFYARPDIDVALVRVPQFCLGTMVTLEYKTIITSKHLSLILHASSYNDIHSTRASYRADIIYRESVLRA